MNTPVSLKLAMLLKANRHAKVCNEYYGRVRKYEEYKLRFCQTSSHMWHELNSRYAKTDAFLAPSIADVVMWIYKNHGIYIWVSQELSDSRDFSWRFRNDVGATPPTGAYPEPSEAYEAAIEYVLTNMSGKHENA